MKTVKFIHDTACFMVFENGENIICIFVNKLKMDALNSMQKDLLTKYCESLINHYTEVKNQDVFSDMLEAIIDGQRVFIISNGSKWHGQEPDDIETLLNVLENYTLEHTFEQYGNFYKDIENGIISFYGQFHNISHVFNIISLDHAVNEKLIAAIENNKHTIEYENAK